MKYLALFLFVPIFSLGQDCIYEPNEIDKTSGRKVIETKLRPLHINMARGYKIGFKKVGSAIYLQLGLMVMQIKDVQIVKGDELIIVFDHGEKLVLHSFDDYQTVYSVGLGNSEVRSSYLINSKTLATFSKTTIHQLRVTFKTGYYAIECTQDARKNKVRELARCIK